MKSSITIVKVGGAVVEDSGSLSSLLDSFSKIGGGKILVVGGGRRATGVAEALGIGTTMIEGRRVTDRQTLEVVTMVYAGLVNKNIVAGLQKRGVNAIGLCGADLDIIRSRMREKGKVDYGYVGDPVKVNTAALVKLIGEGCVPVICSITHDGNGQLLNTNADTVAGIIASALAGEYEVNLVYCFEKAGVLADAKDDGSVIKRIDRDSYERLKADGTIEGGMIPKLENALCAVEKGVKKVIITNAVTLGGEGGTEIYA